MSTRVASIRAAVMSASAVALVLDLHTWEVSELEPEGFGAPRDRGWNGREDVYTEHGIELLVAELHARGEDTRAVALREAWLDVVSPAPRTPAELWYQKGPMQ